VADEAEITGTIRSLEPGVRARLTAATERISDGIAAAMGLESELTWMEPLPAVVNDPRVVACGLEVARELLGADRVIRLGEPPMTADDFALIAALVPSLYFKLGTCGAPPCAPLHNGAFDVDERAIGVGLAVMLAITQRLLEQPLDHWAVG
jgi:metal-dependent amidase/aminoacylase/carboxypeptidase family protein